MKLALSAKPENYSALVARSLRLYRHILKPTFFFALIVSFILFIPRLICVAVGQNVFIASQHWDNQQWLLLVMYISILWFFAALLWGIHCVQMGKHEKFIAELEVAGKRLLYVLGAAIILLIIVSLSALVALFFHFIFTKLNLYSYHRYVKIFLLFLVLLARVAIPVYLFLLFYFYYPLIVIKNDGIFLALKESAQMVWGHAWRTLCLIATPWFYYLVTLIAIKMAFNLNLHIYFMPIDSVPSLAATILNILILSLFIPWSGSMILVQLRDLELRRKAGKKRK